MKMKIRFTFKLPDELVDTEYLNEDTPLEVYIEDGMLVVNTLDEDECSDFKGSYCDNCPFYTDDEELCPTGKYDCINCDFFDPVGSSCNCHELQ
ncbi:MAG: hypothetical protein A2Y17_10495 [Clostridiales bacterium GWF2_38_85]|nr:MAG: hypothetical protein A2Y17_10495 [Clostridiales bacterium GWF2_38_85]